MKFTFQSPLALEELHSSNPNNNPRNNLSLYAFRKETFLGLKTTKRKYGFPQPLNASKELKKKKKRFDLSLDLSPQAP